MQTLKTGIECCPGRVPAYEKSEKNQHLAGASTGIENRSGGRINAGMWPRLWLPYHQKYPRFTKCPAVASYPRSPSCLRWSAPALRSISTLDAATRKNFVKGFEAARLRTGVSRSARSSRPWCWSREESRCFFSKDGHLRGQFAYRALSVDRNFDRGPKCRFMRKFDDCCAAIAEPW